MLDSDLWRFRRLDSAQADSRALLPASANACCRQGFSVIGCAKTPYSNEKFRETMADAVRKFSEQPSSVDEPPLKSFTESLYYLTDNFGDCKAYKQLGDLLDKLDSERGTGGNRLYYLATPPSTFPVIVGHLGSAGLGQPRRPGKKLDPRGD